MAAAVIGAEGASAQTSKRRSKAILSLVRRLDPRERTFWHLHDLVSRRGAAWQQISTCSWSSVTCFPEGVPIDPPPWKPSSKECPVWPERDRTLLLGAFIDLASHAAIECMEGVSQRKTPPSTLTPLRLLAEEVFACDAKGVLRTDDDRSSGTRRYRPILDLSGENPTGIRCTLSFRDEQTTDEHAWVCALQPLVEEWQKQLLWNELVEMQEAIKKEQQLKKQKKLQEDSDYADAKRAVRSVKEGLEQETPGKSRAGGETPDEENPMVPGRQSGAGKGDPTEESSDVKQEMSHEGTSKCKPELPERVEQEMSHEGAPKSIPELPEGVKQEMPHEGAPKSKRELLEIVKQEMSQEGSPKYKRELSEKVKRDVPQEGTPKFKRELPEKELKVGLSAAAPSRVPSESKGKSSKKDRGLEIPLHPSLLVETKPNKLSRSPDEDPALQVALSDSLRKPKKIPGGLGDYQEERESELVEKLSQLEKQGSLTRSPDS